MHEFDEGNKNKIKYLYNNWFFCMEMPLLCKAFDIRIQNSSGLDLKAFCKCVSVYAYACVGRKVCMLPSVYEYVYVCLNLSLYVIYI